MPEEYLEPEGARLVQAQFVRDAAAAARRHGADLQALLAAADISPTLDRPVHIEQFARLWKDVGRAIDDDFLDFGERPLPSGGIDFLAHGLIHSASFREAIVRALDYLRILIDRPRAGLEVNGDLAEVVFDESGDTLTPFAYHLVWIIIGGLTGWLVGRRVALRQVDFCCPPPQASAAYRDIMRAPVHFSRPRTRFIFNAEYLDLPVIRHRESLDGFVAQLPGILLLRHWDERTLSSAIRRKLRVLPPADWPTFEKLAKDMDIPASSLRRKLRVEGHSYRAIKDDIRRTRAVQALLHSDLSVEQIAAALGFAEPSAFHRAFRTWVSSSPGAFRRNNIAAR
jgi:AraC-like DNA-binding protein